MVQIQLEPLLEKLFELLQPHFADSISENLYKWSQDNILLITYGDTICSQNGNPPLDTLNHFLKTHLQDVVTGCISYRFVPSVLMMVFR